MVLSSRTHGLGESWVLLSGEGPRQGNHMPGSCGNEKVYTEQFQAIFKVQRHI